MRITIDISEDLMSSAMEATNSKTKVGAIRKALRRIIDFENTKKLISFKGKVDLDIDLDVLRARKNLN